MTFNTILFIVGLFITSVYLPTAYAGATPPDQTQQQHGNKTVILDMQNMTCAMCKFTIKKALQGVDGVAEANVDYDSKTSKITYNPQKTSVDALIKATTDAGYPANVHPTKQ